MKSVLGFALCGAVALSAPAFAQTQESETAKTDTPDRGVFAGDWVTAGIGAGFAPSYEGSDD